jgi:diguanylate cyclase (GGDEF)-like protein
MDQQDDTNNRPRPGHGYRFLPPARRGLESIRQLPLLGATLLLLGAMLYGPHLEAWERTLILLVLVAGGAGLLRTMLEPQLPRPATVAASPAAGVTPAQPPPPRPLLRLVGPIGQRPHGAPPAREADPAAQEATDQLTGRYSRRECRKMLALMFVRATRFHSPLALVVVQVEQLERIAAMFGGAVADTVLVELAAFLSQQVRGGDVVARWDNAAFALLLPGTALQEAEELTTQLQDAIANAFFAGFGQLSCAIGAADSNHHASADALANAAVRRATSNAPRRNA